MRRRLSAAALLLTTAALVGSGSAGAVTPGGTGSGDAVATRASGCFAGVVGFQRDHHVRYDQLRDGVLVSSRVSRRALPFDVTAWGYYDSSGTARRNRLQLDVVSSDGKPRSVTLRRTRTSVEVGATRRYDQTGFSPRLFADGYTYFAYAVKGGTLKRWTLTRFPDGDVRYAQPVTVARRVRDLTALQTGSVEEVRGVPSELLYATTSTGKLLQLVVPLDHPGRPRVHTLARTGYAGVTELAWTICGRGRTHHGLVAIDPVAGRATWTTVDRVLTRPVARLRGDVVGEADWTLAAVL